MSTTSGRQLEARVDGSTIVVTIELDQRRRAVQRPRPGHRRRRATGSYAITLREGHGPEDVACIAIAELHKTEIPIPDVAPGTYQITDATGGAAPIEVTVG